MSKYSFIFIFSALGAILLFYLSICAFINMEALKLQKAHHNASGFALLVATLVYGGLAYYCYKIFKKTNEDYL